MPLSGLIAYPKPAYFEGRHVPTVDASDMVEKGQSGETYRPHYAIDLHIFRRFRQ